MGGSIFVLQEECHSNRRRSQEEKRASPTSASSTGS